MWNLFREWLGVSSVVRGPEETRRIVGAGAATGLRLGRLLLLAAWWLLLLLYVAGAAWYAAQGRGEQAGLMLGSAAVLLFLRWLWRTFRRSSAAPRGYDPEGGYRYQQPPGRR